MISSGKIRYLLYFLLAAYVVFLGSSIYQIRSILAHNMDYLMAAQEDTRDIRSRVNEMRNIYPGLLSNSDLDYEASVRELNRQEAFRDRAIDSLARHYPGDHAEVEALRKALADFRREVRSLARELEKNGSYEIASQRFNQELMPHIRQIIAQLNAINISLSRSVADLQARIQLRLKLTLIFSILIGCVIIAAFMLAGRAEQAKNREIAWRDNLFATLCVTVDEVVIVAANADRFIFVTPNSQRLLGVAAPLILENPEAFYQLFGDAAAAAWIRNFLSGAKVPENLANTAIPSVGRFFKIGLYPLAQQGAKGERYLVIITDQTPAMRQQEALGLALENARAASAAKSGFLSHMSHEIRTPMNAIIGMTTIALAKIGNTVKVTDCLEKISQSSRHLLGLINDVLDMSKIESGKLSINSEPFSLDQTISSVTQLVGPQFRNRGIHFDVYLEKVDVDDLVGDQLRLNQILLNILSNACKFTPSGGSASLKIRQLQKTGSRVDLQFEVTDTGIGMSQEFLKRIYDPFEQASSGTAAKYGGTGLGMPITRSLVLLMGGSIHVESREGEGTRFLVDLPFALGVGQAPQNFDLPSLNILVVDDDAGALEHAGLLLEKMGLNAEFASSGKDAVELVGRAVSEGRHFDVCIIDWKMPGMDGAETARKIRAVAGDEMLIIIASAYDWSPIEDEAREAGVNDFLAKPFFSSSLHDALARSTRRLAADRPAQSDAPKFSGRRVLLVEDNEFNREIGQEFLEMAGIEVENAINGQEAVQKFEASAPGHFDLILMDVQMPVMDGYEATEKIRASDHPEAKTMPILAMTANAFSEDVARALASGMNGHIAKPIDVNRLYAVLREWFEKPHA